MSLKVKKLVVGQLQTNCYLVYDRAQAIIVDPGDAADFIIRTLADLDVEPIKIVATHGHFDHLLAATELKLAFNIPFVINAKDKFLLDKLQASAQHFLGIEVDPKPLVDKFIDNKTKIKIGRFFLSVLETPGLTPGSVSLYSQEAGFVLVGDTIFAGGGIGRVDFQYSDQEKLRLSIEKLMKLPPKTAVYPGHGEPTTIGRWQKHYFTF